MADINGDVNEPPRPADAAPRSIRDLLIIGGFLVVVFLLGALTGLFEHLSDWLLTREQTGGAFALVALLAIGAAVFSVLRWRQSEVETGKRIDAERSYRLLVEQAPVVIYAWDPSRPTGEVAPVFVSPQIEMLLGYTADRVDRGAGAPVRSGPPR